MFTTPFYSLWRLYLSKSDELDNTNCLSFFSLTNKDDLPKVLELLNKKDENRAIKLGEYVDWFGFYSSPLKNDFLTCATLYTKRPRILPKLARLEKHMTSIYGNAKKELLEKTHPRTVFKLLTRHMAF